MKLQGSIVGKDPETVMLAAKKLIELTVLKKHVEHPTKPGYRRLDIVKKVTELEKEINKLLNN